MLYYLEIELQKIKLNEMIDNNASYKEILKQSRKVDKLINKYLKIIYPFI